MTHEKLPAVTAEDIATLAINVRQLHEETRLLRMAIDELRDDVVWAARNCLQGGYLPTGEQPSLSDTSPCRPEPLQAPAAPPTGQNVARVTPAIAPTSQVPSTHSHPVSNTAAADQKTNPTTPTTPQPVLSAAKKGPLHLRLYYHEPLTAVARAIGYEEVSRDEWQQRLASLNERHDPGLIGAAVRELIEITADKRVRLKSKVRPIAIGLLGRPPQTEMGAST